MRRKPILIAGLTLFAAWFAVGYLATSQVVGEQPHLRRMVAQPQDFGLTADRARFPSPDGIPLVAWWLPASGTPKGTVILAHGRDANRSHMLSRAAFLVRNGYHALAVDLRAHGESGGNYMTPGYREARDLLGGVAYLRRHVARHGPIAVLGHSFGAVAALHAAAQSSDITAVIAESAFLSPTQMMSRIVDVVAREPSASIWAKLGVRLAASRWAELAVLPVYFLRTGVVLDSRQAAASAAITQLGPKPVLLITGERDPIAPPEDAQHMYEAARSPRKALFIVPGAGHNNCYRLAPQAYESAVLQFLERAFSQMSSP